jgi:hypothetical protein
MEPDQITSEWLSSRLGADVRITSEKRIGDGLVGMNMRYGLDVPAGSGLPSSIIAKLPSPDPTSRATGIALRNYEREVKFYEVIAPTVDICVARCWHSDWDEGTGDFVLLMEDLSPAEQGNQITGCSVELARRSVLELARLHGPRWADPTLDGIEFLQRRGPGDAEQLQMIYSMMLPGFLATYSRHLDQEGTELVERFAARIPDWLAGRDLPSTVTHGDYRLDNLMFASAVGGHPIATVDWQTPGHGQATADISYFMGAGPLTDDRRAIERGLLDEYLQALDGYGVSVDAEDFWRHYCRDAYSGVVMSVVASQIVGASDRSEAMFTAMATRHVRHALDLGAESLI